MIKILHIIQSLTIGGGARAMIAIAKYSAQQGTFHHSAISLNPADPRAIKEAKKAGMNVFNAPDEKNYSKRN